MVCVFFQIFIFHTDNWFLSHRVISLGGRIKNSDSASRRERLQSNDTDTGEAAMKHWWCLFAGNQTPTAASLASLPQDAWVQSSWEQRRAKGGAQQRDCPSHNPVRLWNDWLVSNCYCTCDWPTPLSAMQDCTSANTHGNRVLRRRLLYWLWLQNSKLVELGRTTLRMSRYQCAGPTLFFLFEICLSGCLKVTDDVKCCPTPMSLQSVSEFPRREKS